MKIVIELTLLVSFIINYFVLKLSSQILKLPLRLGVLSAFLGGVADVIYPLFHIHGLILFIFFFALLVLVNLISFKYQGFKNFAMRFFLTMFLTFLFGGAMQGIQTFFGSISLYVVMGLAVFMYILCKIIVKCKQRQNIIDNFTYDVTLKNKGQYLQVQGFLDSGNMLYDTITKKPIMLVNFEVFHKLFGEISFLNVITKSFDESKIKNGHYIKVNSLSSGASMLVFSVDEAKIGDKRCVKEPMLGLSLSGFEKSFKRDVLLHGELV